MRLPYKLLLIAVSLPCLALSVCILALHWQIPFLTGKIAAYLKMFPWLGGVFAAFAAFVLLCFFTLLLIALFYPVSTGDAVFIKEKGKLRFSRQAVESTARHSFGGVQGIGYCEVKAKVRGKPEKTCVFVKLVLTETDNMAELADDVRVRVENALMSSLGINAKFVGVDVKGVAVMSQESGDAAE